MNTVTAPIFVDLNSGNIQVKPEPLLKYNWNAREIKLKHNNLQDGNLGINPVPKIIHITSSPHMIIKSLQLQPGPKSPCYSTNKIYTSSPKHLQVSALQNEHPKVPANYPHHRRVTGLARIKTQMYRRTNKVGSILDPDKLKWMHT